MGGRVSVELRRRQVTESLQVGNPGNHARDLAAPNDLRGDCQLELSIDEIRPYEHNPRRATNAKFEDIKESIRTSGLRSPLAVTRRPGESRFIVEAGGNTRLLALRQLWAETRDPRFRTLTVLFRPWQSESHILTAHLIENELRGDMTFWDKASGIVALKARLEAEAGQPLALRPLEDALHARGLSVNTATLGLQLFAAARLRVLGDAVAELSGLDIKMLQPRLNALKRYAQARTSMTEDALYAEVFEPVFRRVAEQYPRTGAFSVAATCEACEAALAGHLGESVARLREALRPEARRGASPDASTFPARGGEGARAASGGRPAAVEASEGAATRDDGLLARARRFADAAGLRGVVHPGRPSTGGLRLAALAAEDAAHPERQQAWSLLAALVGLLDSDAPSRASPDAALLRWVVDPADPAAEAFWELLAWFRHSGAVHQARTAASESVASSGDA